MTRKEPVKAIVTRRFRAVPERVFDAFLDPAKAGRFLFATKAGTIVRAEIDPRVGGAYCFTDRRAGENVEHRGTYVEIDRPRRLVLTPSVDQFGQDHDLVTIEIEPDGTGSALTLTHAMGPDLGAYQKRTEQGWTAILENLARTLGETFDDTLLL